MLSFLLLAAVSSGPSFKINAVSIPTLPYLITYMSCYDANSDLAKALISEADGTAEQLPALCRARRQDLYDAAIQKLRDLRSDDILQEKRRLDRAFNIVEKNNPLPATASTAK